VSTGVIGARLPLPKILGALPKLLGEAHAAKAPDFARAIMTTDTHPKVVHRDDGARTVGFGKGAGMIHPRLATMLGFVLSDGRLPADPIALLRRVVDRSFHRLSIDGDTSPNDTVLLWSTQRRQVEPARLEAAVLGVAQDLCKQIAADGEGATRFVTVEVRGARTEDDATHTGRTIATSMLTKTAITGRDPNWGRILSAAGRAGVPIDVERARVWIGDAVVYEDGRPHPEREPAAHAHLRDLHDIRIGVDLGVGDAAAEVWTCDLTADYVRINADYRS
jgi:glutamate N-acetyltransferase/amino-acid N-acetyltransferase